MDRLSRLLALLLLLPMLATAQSPPILTAEWVSPRTAVVTWSAPGNLYRVRGGLTTWLLQAAGPGSVVLEPSGVYQHQPHEGDIYRLDAVPSGEPLAEAQLGEEPDWYRVILPIVAQGP